MKDAEKFIRIVEFADSGYQGPATSNRQASYRYAISFAVVCAVAVMLLVIPFHKTPEFADTYDNPALAYAKLEQSFSKIGHAMNRGIELTETTYNKMTYENNE